MTRRRMLPVVILLLLVAGISLAFLERRGGSTSHREGAAPEAPSRPGPFDGIAPRLRGFPNTADGEVSARRLVDAVLESVEGSPRPAILAALHSTDWGVQWAGLLAIPRYGPSDEALAAAVRAALSSDLAHVRRTAAEAAAYLARAQFGALLGDLRTAAGDADPAVRSSALRTLARRAPDHVALVPLFEMALADGDDEARAAGAYGLAQIELQEKLPVEAVARLRPILVHALADPVTDVVVYAVMALGRAGPLAAEDVPAILALLDDERALVRGQAATALGSIGEPALPAIERALDPARGRALAPLFWALRQMGAPGQALLAGALDHESPLIRALAAQQLWEQDVEVARAGDVLIKALGSEDLDAQRVAVRTFSRMGPEGTRALPALRALREHPDEALRASVSAAVVHLEQLGG